MLGRVNKQANNFQMGPLCVLGTVPAYQEFDNFLEERLQTKLASKNLSCN